jgi:hypothetical protein
LIARNVQEPSESTRRIFIIRCLVPRLLRTGRQKDRFN